MGRNLRQIIAHRLGIEIDSGRRRIWQEITGQGEQNLADFGAQDGALGPAQLGKSGVARSQVGRGDTQARCQERACEMV